jgi:hypothetical protein
MLGASTTSYRKSIMFATDPGAVAVQIILSTVDAFALTMLVFFRKEFGERVLTPFRYALGISILTFVMAVRAVSGTIFSGLGMLFGGPLMGMMTSSMMRPPPGQQVHTGLFDGAVMLYWAYIIWGGFQLALVFYRSYRAGKGARPVYSKSMGESRLTFNGRVNHWVATILLEPLAVISLGYVLVLCDPSLPVSYFIVLAVFIQLSAIHQYRLYRDDLLDTRDAQLLAGFYAEQANHIAAGQKPLARLAGVFLPLMLPRKPEAQVDVLRRWAKEHAQAAANDEEAPPPVPPSATA